MFVLQSYYKIRSLECQHRRTIPSISKSPLDSRSSSRGTGSLNVLLYVLILIRISCVYVCKISQDPLGNKPITVSLSFVDISNTQLNKS